MTPKRPSLFANMNWLDWILAVAFTIILGFIASLYLPLYGWILGALAALALLYLAKKRRDAYFASQEANRGKDSEEEQPKV